MAQQKSEDRVVPEDGVIPSSSSGRSRRAREGDPGRSNGGAAQPADRDSRSPQGSPATRPAWASGREPEGVVTQRQHRRRRWRRSPSVDHALLKVVSNKGAPGPDGQTSRLREQWSVVFPSCRRPAWRDVSARRIRRAYIPKLAAGSAVGIPDVIDRVVHEAVRQVLEPLWEPTFHPSSHGFRPGGVATRRSPKPSASAGRPRWCVDIDLEKFFDRVCHQRLWPSSPSALAIGGCSC